MGIRDVRGWHLFERKSCDWSRLPLHRHKRLLNRSKNHCDYCRKRLNKRWRRSSRPLEWEWVRLRYHQDASAKPVRLGSHLRLCLFRLLNRDHWVFLHRLWHSEPIYRNRLKQSCVPWHPWRKSLVDTEDYRIPLGRWLGWRYGVQNSLSRSYYRHRDLLYRRTPWLNRLFHGNDSQYVTDCLAGRRMGLHLRLRR